MSWLNYMKNIKVFYSQEKRIKDMHKGWHNRINNYREVCPTRKEGELVIKWKQLASGCRVRIKDWQNL